MLIIPGSVGTIRLVRFLRFCINHSMGRRAGGISFPLTALFCVDFLSALSFLLRENSPSMGTTHPRSKRKGFALHKPVPAWWNVFMGIFAHRNRCNQGYRKRDIGKFTPARSTTMMSHNTTRFGTSECKHGTHLRGKFVANTQQHNDAPCV